MTNQCICVDFTPTSPHGGAFHTAFQGVRKMYLVSKQRKSLSQLSPSQLQDIGVSQEQALIEVSRPFWDI